MISKILDVTDSGAGPPFEMLYLLHFTNTQKKGMQNGMCVSIRCYAEKVVHARCTGSVTMQSVSRCI